MTTSAASTRATGLADIARATSDPRRIWRPAQDLSETRNAHRSNTEHEMRDALQSDYNWLEGDVRIDRRGTVVMAHDASDEGRGLDLAEWIRIGAAGQRGLKVDVKEPEAIPKLVAQLAQSRVPQHRIMVNVSGEASAQTVRAIRAQLPDAWIAIGPKLGRKGYSASAVNQAIELGRAAGGNVAYVLRWDIASDSVIQTIRRSETGRVSIWTGDRVPVDRAAATRELRARGVDGVIDIGEGKKSSGSLLNQLGRGIVDGVQRGVDLLTPG